MISIQNISIAFGGEKLFDSITFTVNEKERIGLAGKNGAGKTTLLNIISKKIVPLTGSITLPAGMEIGYLPQEKTIRSNCSVMEETLSIFQNIILLKKEIVLLEKEIANRTDYESKYYLKLIEKINEINHQLKIFDLQKSEGNAEKVLKGLGFRHQDFAAQVKTFSFGWQMRIELAKLLLLQPGLLLLDEPTNHLDIDSIQWFENFLKTYNGSVILVSHDRSLLDNLTTRTIEINNRRIYDYKVPYTRYIQLRNERISQQKLAFDNQQKEIKQIEHFIERFRYKATKAKQVQSRVKLLSKMDKVNIDDIDNVAIHFAFPPAPRAGKVIVEAISLSKSYGEKLVIDAIDFHVIRGEKLAFVGRNGEGKSTLSKIIAKQLTYDGTLKFSNNIQIGYYAQDQWEMLNSKLTVFETLDNIAVGDTRKYLKNILASFLFRGDEIYKKVKVLSGGEKARLSLAKLLLSPTNLLILDEPTNHLDLTTKDILKNALFQYDGTLIIVSHDRDFLEGLTNRIFVFGNRKIKEYRGDVLDYLKKQKIEKLTELERKETIYKNENTVSQNKKYWQQKKEHNRKIRKLENKILNIENKIESQEKFMNVIKDKLAKPELHKIDISSGTLYKQYAHEEILLKELYEKWELLQLELEQLKIDFEKLHQY